MSNLSKPKKSLGQHFLINAGIHRRIVEFAKIIPADIVVEVGPGRGGLTKELWATGASVIGIEKDHALSALLLTQFDGHMHAIEDDILTWDPHSSPLPLIDHEYVLVGNIPYYLTSHLIRTVLMIWPKPRTIIFMVQKEVAERMTAKPPNMNMLAVLVQYYTTPKIMMRVKKENFYPKPKIDSAIIRMEPRPQDSLPITDSSFFALVHRGFAHPRKMLHSSISAEVLKLASIDSSRRPGTLTIEEWKRIALAVHK